MGFLNKIDDFCAQRHISSTRFEREAGLGKGLIPKWRKKGIIPSLKSQVKMADYMGITVQDLMSEDLADMYNTSIPDNWPHSPDIVRDATVRYIPVFNYNGIQLPDPEDISMHLAVLPENLDAADECLGMTIKDSGMSPEIEIGDIVIIRKDPSPESGDIVVVTEPGDNTVCRRLIVAGDNYILQPFNKHFVPVVYRKEELELLPVLFTGTVIAIVRRVSSSSYSVAE